MRKLTSDIHGRTLRNCNNTTFYNLEEIVFKLLLIIVQLGVPICEQPKFVNIYLILEPLTFYIPE
jgi:hypothetical protein